MDRRSVEAGLNQKLITLENAAACVASAKASLRTNVESVRKEISDSISHQMSLIRAREQELHQQLDALVAKMEINFSEQQQQIHTGIGACQQALDSVHRNEGIPTNAVDILMKLNHVEQTPKEIEKIEFERDSLKLRSGISTFGVIRSVSSPIGMAQSGESLPREIEDYEDDFDMSHKSVLRLGNLTNDNMGTLAQSSTVQRWLKHIPSGAVALDADISALMAEFEVIKATSPPPEIDPSESSSFDVIREKKTTSDCASVVSKDFAKMLSLPLSEWLLQSGLPLSDDPLDRTNNLCSRTTKRRHSVDNPVKAKRYEFEDIIRNIQQSHADAWFIDSSEIEQSENENSNKDDNKLLVKKNDGSTKQIVSEAEYMRRLALMFKMYDNKRPSSSSDSAPKFENTADSDLYWKEVIEGIQKSYNWLADRK